MKSIRRNLLLALLGAMCVAMLVGGLATYRVAHQEAGALFDYHLRQLALSVRDHGPGIPTEARQRLFEPFYTTRTGGLGLGLTLCDSLAQAMGAQLALAPEATPPSAAQRGAEFVLTLQAAPPTDDR